VGEVDGDRCVEAGGVGADELCQARADEVNDDRDVDAGGLGADALCQARAREAELHEVGEDGAPPASMVQLPWEQSTTVGVDRGSRVRRKN
jgi:hypothetical protein